MSGLFANDYNLEQLEKITPKVFGFDLYVTPRFKTHYLEKTYEETTALLLRQIARSVNTFIDVGAHYGFYDVLVGKSNHDCRILAFEPVPENREVLQKNLKLNKIEATVVQAAVSDRAGRQSFQVSEASDNSGFIANPSVGIVNNFETDVVQLDQYLPQILNGPVLIKIDTEGNEIQVLDGMQEILRQHNDLRMIIEFNPKCLKANGDSPQNLLDKIHELGFDIFFIDDVDHKYEKYQPGQDWRSLMGESGYRNLLCARQNRTTNLLIFSHSSQLAGAERSLLSLVKDLTSDHETVCTVILPTSGPLEELLHQVGAVTLIAPLNWWCAENELPDQTVIGNLYAQSFAWLHDNLQRLDQIKTDVVLTSTLVIPWGAVAAFLLKRPHIWKVNEFGELDHGLNFFMPFPQILDFIEKSSQKIVTCSRAIQDELFPNVDATKVTTLYYSIDIPEHLEIAPADNFFRLPDAFHVIISGSVTRSKGQEDALRAVIELVKRRKRSVELVIAGYAEPEYQTYLQGIIDSELISDYIHIVPFQENILPIVHSADLVLVCSKMEAFGRVTLEAMLMEKPVIATNTGGTLEMIFDEKTGLLYTPGNYLELADKIEYLLKDTPKRKKLAKNARQFAEKTFTPEKFGGKFHNIIMDIQLTDDDFEEGSFRFLIDQYQQLIIRKDAALVDQKSEQDQKIQILGAQVEETAQQVQDLKTLVAEGAQKLQASVEHLAERDQQVQALMEHVAERDQQIQKLAVEISDRGGKLHVVSAHLEEITGSKAWKLALFVRGTRIKFFPPGSRREKLALRAYSGLKIWREEGLKALLRSPNEATINSDAHHVSDYLLWIQNNEPRKDQLAQQRIMADELEIKPLISIIMPVWNTPEKILDQTINSVLDQTYDQWELCIADGNSKSETKRVLSEWAKKDHRIHLEFLEENLGIAGNTNAAISLATGEFIALLDHDDLLAPFALFEVVMQLQANQSADIFYSDEDKVDRDGHRSDPFFKPDFSPDYLRSLNYVAHFLVIRKSLGDQIGWLREGYDGAQDYDLILRAIEASKRIVHISKILYHWRVWSESTAQGDEAKPYANLAGKKVLQEHLNRIGLPGKVEDGFAPTYYRIHYQIQTSPLISIIIPNHDHSEDLKRCIDSFLDQTTYSNFEVILVENGSKEQATFTLYEQLKGDSRIQIINWDQKFNFSTVNNYAAAHASGEVYLFLNNDTEIINKDWLEQMLQYANHPDIGTVGSKLYYPDGTIQHGGVIVGLGGVAGHSHKHFPQHHPGYFLRLVLPQNVSAVTAACVMVRKDVFDEVNGFDEKYSLAFGDVDLCLKVVEKGYLNVWTPYAELYHHESKTRGIEDTHEKQARFNREVEYFKQKWSSFLQNGDPYYNPNLSLDREDFSIDPTRKVDLS
jgi:O-antigen biosynthesis protein